MGKETFTIVVSANTYPVNTIYRLPQTLLNLKLYYKLLIFNFETNELLTFLLMAQPNQGGTEGGGGGGDELDVYLLLLIICFYFMIRPQQKKENSTIQMLLKRR